MRYAKGPRLVRVVVPCAQTRVAIEMRTAQSATCFERPAQQATEPRVKQEVRSVLCHSLVVDSMFEQSKNIVTTRFFVVNLSSCSWPVVRGVVYTIIV